MQNYKYDKAIVPESKNGGSPALNNNPRKGGSKRVLLICLDLFCLFMGERSPTGHPPPSPGPRRAVSPGGPQPSSGRRASRELPALPDPQSQTCEHKLGRACAFAAAGKCPLGVISSWGAGHSPSEGVSSSSTIWRQPVALLPASESVRDLSRSLGEPGSYGSGTAGPGCM